MLQYVNYLHILVQRSFSTKLKRASFPYFAKQWGLSFCIFMYIFNCLWSLITFLDLLLPWEVSPVEHGTACIGGTNVNNLQTPQVEVSRLKIQDVVWCRIWFPHQMPQLLLPPLKAPDSTHIHHQWAYSDTEHIHLHGSKELEIMYMYVCSEWLNTDIGFPTCISK